MITNYTQFYEAVNYLHYLPYNDTSNEINLAKDDEFKDIIYAEPTEKNIDILNKFLRANKRKIIVMYHGTSPEHDILNNGLFTTKERTKRSRQSQPGFVYLSIYPDMAKTFGNLGYGISNAVVYEVRVPIEFLKPDLDQIHNVRQFGGINCGSTLADSILYGHGARVKGNLPPYMITKYKK